MSYATITPRDTLCEAVLKLWPGARFTTDQAGAILHGHLAPFRVDDVIAELKSQRGRYPDKLRPDWKLVRDAMFEQARKNRRKNDGADHIRSGWRGTNDPARRELLFADGHQADARMLLLWQKAFIDYAGYGWRNVCRGGKDGEACDILRAGSCPCEWGLPWPPDGVGDDREADRLLSMPNPPAIHEVERLAVKFRDAALARRRDWLLELWGVVSKLPTAGPATQAIAGKWTADIRREAVAGRVAAILEADMGGQSPF